MRLSAARALLVLSAGVVSGTGVGCVKPPPPAPIAYLRVTAVPPETTVYDNDRFLGTARLLAKQPKELHAGVKFLSFKAPGYFPHDLRVELPAGETNITIKLRPIPQ